MLCMGHVTPRARTIAIHGAVLIGVLVLDVAPAHAGIRLLRVARAFVCKDNTYRKTLNYLASLTSYKSASALSHLSFSLLLFHLSS